MFQVIEARWNPAKKRQDEFVRYECESIKEAVFVEKEVIKTIRKDRRGLYMDGGQVSTFIKEVK